jgi:hypothetical protein
MRYINTNPKKKENQENESEKKKKTFERKNKEPWIGRLI